MIEQRPSSGEIAQALYGYAAELMKSGQSDWQVKGKLMEKGVDEQSASIIVENLKMLRECCVNCGKEGRLQPYTLSRAQQYGRTIVTRRGNVLLCNECHEFFSRANGYRISGILLVFLGAFLFFALGNQFSLIWPICVVVGLLFVGAFLVIKGRRRIATLEKRVGFK